MRYSEITTKKLTDEIKPKTPEQQRLANLKATKDRADQALKQERAQQQIRKAQQSIKQLPPTLPAS